MDWIDFKMQDLSLEPSLQVEMLVVDDDCALPPQRITGRRGLAGTVLVHKVLTSHGCEFKP